MILAPKKSNPCSDSVWLSLFLDGELTPREADAVRRHLTACAACRREMALLAEADDLVRELPVLTPSDTFERTFWQKVEQAEARSPFRKFSHYLVTGWRPILVGGLAGLAAVAIFSLGPHAQPSSEEVFIATHMELLDEFEVIHNLDLLEAWEALEALEERS